MNTRETSLLGVVFPQGKGVPDREWRRILSKPSVTSILVSFGPDNLDVVKTEIRNSIGTLFRMSVLEILVKGWKRYDEVCLALEKSKQTPNDPIIKPLAKHTFKSVHHPYIELYMDDVPLGKIEFESTVALDVEGVQLRIQDGEVSEILAGSCQGSVQLAFAGEVLSRVQTGKIPLPGSVALTQTAKPSDDAMGLEDQQRIRNPQQEYLRQQQEYKSVRVLPLKKSSSCLGRLVGVIAILVGFAVVLLVCIILAFLILNLYR